MLLKFTTLLLDIGDSSYGLEMLTVGPYDEPPY